jgi:hypothetical protein
MPEIDRGRVETSNRGDHAIQRARKRFGELLPRYARLRRLMDFIEVVSKVARQMRVAARSAQFIAQQ